MGPSAGIVKFREDLLAALASSAPQWTVPMTRMLPWPLATTLSSQPWPLTALKRNYELGIVTPGAALCSSCIMLTIHTTNVSLLPQTWAPGSESIFFEYQ